MPFLPPYQQRQSTEGTTTTASNQSTEGKYHNKVNFVTLSFSLLMHKKYKKWPNFMTLCVMKAIAIVHLKMSN